MKRKKVLITGAVSLIGKYFVKEYIQSYQLVLTTHKKQLYEFPKLPHYPLDITDPQKVMQLVKKIRPDVIIHLAALSNIDYCQQHPESAKTVNVDGTRHIVDAISGTDCHLVFLSSNAVFDGEKHLYSETDAVRPLNIYGQTKVVAEGLIVKSGTPSTVIRATQTFGWPPQGARDNDVTYYLKELKSKKELFLVNDRFFNPVYALRIAQLISHCIENKKTGLFHIGGEGQVSRYDFVKLLLKIWHLPQPTLTAVSSSYFPALAPRARQGCLSTKKIENDMHVSPFSLESDLIKMRDETS